jgi:predicted anti-sigma-YlaC factor YlaD
MKGIDIPCQQIVEWVTDYLEGALPDETRRLVEEHLADCPPCRLYMDQIRSTVRTLGTVSDDSLSPDAWTELRTAFRDIDRRS